MSQRLYLLNSSIPTSDLHDMEAAAQDKTADIIEIAETSYLVPLPWLACFRVADLRPCQVSLQDVDGNPHFEKIQVPYTELQTAIANLQQSLPLFCRLTGEEILAREYWQVALDMLQKHTLSYLTLDISELLMSQSAAEINQQIILALSRDETALAHMFFDYHSVVLPWTCSEWFGNPNTDDERRDENSRALDCADKGGGFVRARRASAAGPAVAGSAPAPAKAAAQDMRPGPTCPHCGFRIFNPRCAHCESCGRSLSAPTEAAPIVRPPVATRAAGAHNKRHEILHSPMGSDPSTFNHKGFGFALYGKADYEAESGSFLRTHYLVAFHLPLLPLGRYRVYSEGKQHDFMAKVPLRGVDRLHSALFVLGLIALYIYMKVLRA